jgi:hypothetical protein
LDFKIRDIQNKIKIIKTETQPNKITEMAQQEKKKPLKIPHISTKSQPYKSDWLRNKTTTGRWIEIP